MSGLHGTAPGLEEPTSLVTVRPASCVFPLCICDYCCPVHQAQHRDPMRDDSVLVSSVTLASHCRHVRFPKPAAACRPSPKLGIHGQPPGGARTPQFLVEGSYTVWGLGGDSCCSPHPSVIKDNLRKPIRQNDPCCSQHSTEPSQDSLGPSHTVGAP